MIADRFAPARAVADAVLYEGYVLYPYRASSAKNVVRWQFGVLAPRAYVEGGGAESYQQRAECIVEGPPESLELFVRARCLHVEERRVEEATAEGPRAVPSLDVDGVLYLSFDEGIEAEVEVGPLEADRELRHDFTLDGTVTVEDLAIGQVVRERARVDGRLSVRFVEAGDRLTRVVVTLENLAGWAGPGSSRDDVVRRSLVGAHLLLAVDGGTFVSLLDPPPHACVAVAGCKSLGCFPVLASASDSPADLVLASPIILYDHPAVAPESPSDLYDATEIDEILTLRTLSLTDEEKREARATDPRAAAIVDHVESIPPDVLGRLHGVMRSRRPLPEAAAATVTIGSRMVGTGSRVRLHPRRSADAQDMFLMDRLARVTGVFHDFDGETHVAVTIDDDPGADLHEWYGRYRYFHVDELEVLDELDPVGGSGLVGGER